MKEANDFLQFSLPTIEKEEIEEVLDTLKSGWLTTGSKVKRFENEFAKYIGCKHAIAVNSCTAALHLALEAVGIKKGDEIITSPMTFAATSEVIHYFQAKVLFVDIEADTMNLDVNKLEELIKRKCRNGRNSRLKAIIPVHYAGYPCEMDSIMGIAREYDLKVIEDAAHAFPAYYKERMIGKIGDITCFSFYATKTITTGEGGMISTDHDKWADRMRIMSLHGITKDAWKRYTSEGNWYYEIVAPGYKYNLTDIAAALGIAQLRKAEDFWRRRNEIAELYKNAFKDLEEIEIPSVKRIEGSMGGSIFDQVRHSWHLFVIKLNLKRLTIDRNCFIDELKKKRIGTSVHFIPLHIHPYYRETYGYKPSDFPVSYQNYKRIISLPLYPKMADEDVQRVIEAVTDIVGKNRKTRL
jgi:perosamine synthetase